MAGAGDDLIIDAMNVIGSRPTGWWRDRDGAIRDLVLRLCRYAQASAGRVTVVIDGRPLPDLGAGLHGPVEIRYAARAGPDAADDRIVELVAALDGHPIVVTADRALRQRVEDRGARTLGPRWLLQELDRAGEGAR